MLKGATYNRGKTVLLDEGCHRLKRSCYKINHVHCMWHACYYSHVAYEVSHMTVLRVHTHAVGDFHRSTLALGVQSYSILEYLYCSRVLDLTDF